MAPIAPLGLLHVYPSMLAAEHGLDVPVGAAVAADSVTTFDALLRALAPSVSRSLLSPAGIRLVMRQVLLGAQGGLAALARDPGSVGEVARAIGELRSAGITAQHLGAHALSDAARELRLVLESYETTLTKLGYADDADRQREAVLSVARGRLPAWLSSVREVHVEGVGALFGARLDLLNAFAARGVDVVLTIPWDADRSAAFAWSEATLHAVESRGHERLRVQTDPRIGQGRLAPLRAAQLSTAVVTDAPVRIVHVGNSSEQARRIAHEVARWLDEGTPPHAVAVATPDLDGVGAQIGYELAQRGVASFTRRGPPLVETRVAHLLLAALRMRDAGWRSDDLETLWLQLGVDLDSADASWDPPHALAALRLVGVRSGQVRNHREALVAQARAAGERGGIPPTTAARLSDELDRLIATVGAVPQTGTLGDLVRAASGLLADFRQRRVEPEPASGGDLHWPTLQRQQEEARQAAAWVEVARVLDDVEHAAAVVDDEAEWRLDEFATLIEGLLCDARLAPPGLRAGAVSILGIEDLVGTTYRRVVLAGIDEDSFPRALSGDRILTDALRVELNQLLGPRLVQHAAATGRMAIGGRARDQWWWLEALASAGEELVVTYVADAGTHGAGASELVLELARSIGQDVVADPTASDERWGPAPFQLDTADADGVDALRHRIEVVGPALSRAPYVWRPLDAEDRERLVVALLGNTQTVTALDELGKCAFRYFAGQVLGLADPRPVPLSADPRDEGSAAHLALQLVYEDLIPRGGLRAARLEPDAARSRVCHVLAKARDQLFAKVRAHPALWPPMFDEIERLVLRQLETDLKADDAFEPVALEYGFTDKRAGASAPFVLREPGGTRLLRARGQIDRVDVGPDAVRVIDYKRGKTARSAGRHFQLPIYAAVAVRDLKADARTVAAAWAPWREERRQSCADVPQDPADLLASTERDVWARAVRVLGGDISPDPEPRSLCDRCDFAALCRMSRFEGEASDD